MTARILIVDDEKDMRDGLREALGKAGREVETASDGETALAMLAKTAHDVVITDLKMPGLSGMDVLEKGRALRPAATFVMITAFGDIQTAVEAMKKGAADFFTKPFNIKQVREVVEKAIIKLELRSEPDDAEAAAVRAAFPSIVCKSAAMLNVFRMVQKIAKTRSTVLVLGETGTGKELIARAIHEHSPRKNAPFIATSGAIPEGLLESELFGHAKNAFTGAAKEKAGYFEAASTGSLFLDEVADLPLRMQVQLLRVVQEGEVIRVGETKPRKVDVRLVAATNKDLKQSIDAGTFREDLYFRLKVITIKLPPLRERAEDIPALVQHFLDRQRKQGGPALAISDEAMEILKRYPWPGNIRELEHIVTRIAVLSPGPVVKPADLPEEVREPGRS